MANFFQHFGGQAQKATRFAAIWTAEYFTGLYTNRSPFGDGGSRTEKLYVGPRGDALTANSSNVEVSTRLTLARRPGTSVWNSQTWDAPDAFYVFRKFSTDTESISVMVDQANALYDGANNGKLAIWNKSPGAGQSYMQSVGNTLYWGDGINQKKWLQSQLSWTASTDFSASSKGTLTDWIVDPNHNIQVAVGGFRLTTSSVAVTSNVLTLTLGTLKLPTPDAPSSSLISGSLLPGSYYAKVVAVDDLGRTTAAGPETSVLLIIGGIDWTWAPVAGAASYRLYIGTSPGGENQYFSTNTPNFALATLAGGSTGTPPVANTTALSVPENLYRMVGVNLALSAFATATFLNGQTITITSVLPGGTASTKITAAFTHANYADTADAGLAVSGTGVTGSVQPTWATALNAVTQDGGAQWINRGNYVENWGLAAPVAAPAVSQTTPSSGSGISGTATATVNAVDYPAKFTFDDPGQWELSGAQLRTIGVVSGTVLGYVIAHNFGLAVPAGVFINGVQTDLNWVGQNAGTGTLSAESLYYLGAQTGVAKFPSVANMSFPSDTILGGSADTWGATLTPAIINDPSFGFGVEITAQDVGGTDRSFLDSFTITVAYSSLTPTSSSGVKSYGYAYKNSIDDTISNMSPASAGQTLGVGSLYELAGLGSPDIQCDTIIIYATQQGGGIFYELDEIANPGAGQSWAYEDDGSDAALNIEEQAAVNGENTPPPIGIVNLTYHLGRLFGSVNNTVYWSSGPDTPQGNGLNGFDPNNFAIFPSSVHRMVPLATGLLVFTLSDIYIIYGNATQGSPLTPLPYAFAVGLGNYNALDVNGGVIYFYTTDSQIVSLDPNNGLTEIGFPIGDQFQNAPWSPTSSYVTWHVAGTRDKALFVSDGAGDWFRMAPTAAPEQGLTWSPKATIVGGAKAVQSIETTPGVHQLLIGPSGSGPILRRDWNTYADNGTAYPAYFTIGNLVLVHPGQIAELAYLTFDSIRVGKPLTPSVLIDEISGAFEGLPRSKPDPPQLAESLTLYSRRHYFSQSDKPAICRHLQIRCDWATEAQPNEILSSTLYGGFLQER